MNSFIWVKIRTLYMVMTLEADHWHRVAMMHRITVPYKYFGPKTELNQLSLSPSTGSGYFTSV